MLKIKRADCGELYGTSKTISAQLEYIRGELRAERISLGELCELESFTDYIHPSDVELLEAAGVPEFPY